MFFPTRFLFLQIVYIKWELYDVRARKKLSSKAPWWDQNHRALGTYINNNKESKKIDFYKKSRKCRFICIRIEQNYNHVRRILKIQLGPLNQHLSEIISEENNCDWIQTEFSQKFYWRNISNMVLNFYPLTVLSLSLRSSTPVPGPIYFSTEKLLPKLLFHCP